MNTFNISLVNLKKTPEASYDIYIGRTNKFRNLTGSKWGNPFVLKHEVDRPIILEKYREYIMSNKQLYNSLNELKGKKLACWCYDPADPKKVCHGNILIELLEERNRVKGLKKIVNSFYERYFIIKRFFVSRIL